MDWRSKEYKAQKVRNWRARNIEKVRAYARRSMLLFKLKRLGLTERDYEDRLTAQGNKCAVCKKDKNHKLAWMLDHNHKTGKFRGILCGHCNSALGHAHDDPMILRALAAYLECQ